LTILVTGGAGFIGSNLIEYLVNNNFNVKVLDNFSTGKKENLISVVDNIEVIENDIRNFEIVKSVIKNVEYVFHFAALSSVPLSVSNPILANEINITGTLNLLRASAEENVKKFIFASSSAVYGNSNNLPIAENNILKPLSPYAITKLAGEEYCKVFSKIYGLNTVSLRYFNVFGPKQNPLSEYSAVIPKFIKAMKSDNRPVIYGDGLQSRDFIYIENIIDALTKCAFKDFEPGLVMNCACNKQTNLIMLVDYINQILGKTIKPKFENERKGDIKHSYADISLIKNVIDFEPKIDLKEGLVKTISSIN
jgi:UDP-glucose 4-epimerase